MGVTVNVNGGLLAGVLAGAAVAVLVPRVAAWWAGEPGDEETVVHVGGTLTEIAEPEEIDLSEWFEDDEEPETRARPRIGFTC